jgi:hypothetical protein
MTRPIDPNWLAQQGEKYRKQFFAPPDPALAARAASERRWMNSRAHSGKITQHNELISTIDKNNAALVDFGNPAMQIEGADPVDLSWRALDDRIAVLGRVIWQQTDRLDHLRASAAETERERTIANETPIERLEREVAELRAKDQARVEMEAQRSDSQPRERYVPPSRPIPVMSNIGQPMADGLTPGCAIGPRSQEAGAAARRVGGAGRADNRPALAHAQFERHSHGDSPAQFQAAIKSVERR